MTVLPVVPSVISRRLTAIPVVFNLLEVTLLAPMVATAAPMPMLASYDASCSLYSDCAVVAEPACAPCRMAALSAKDAPRYSAALVEAQKTETCQRQIERSGPCSIEGAVIARCSGAVCGLVAAPPPDAGAPADASLD